MRSSMVAAVTLVGIVAVAGCTGEEGPPTTGTTTGTATTGTSHAPSSSTTTGTPSSPTTTVAIPPEATKQTEEGAEAFARFYLRQLSLASRAGDSSLLDGLATPACTGCTALYQVVADLEAKEQHVDIDSMQLAASRIHPDSTDKQPVVNVLAEDLPKRIIAKDGSVVSNVKGAKFDFQLSLAWSPPKWQLISLKVVR